MTQCMQSAGLPSHKSCYPGARVSSILSASPPENLFGALRCAPASRCSEPQSIGTQHVGTRTSRLIQGAEMSNSGSVDDFETAAPRVIGGLFIHRDAIARHL